MQHRAAEQPKCEQYAQGSKTALQRQPPNLGLAQALSEGREDRQETDRINRDENQDQIFKKKRWHGLGLDQKERDLTRLWRWRQPILE